MRDILRYDKYDRKLLLAWRKQRRCSGKALFEMVGVTPPDRVRKGDNCLQLDGT